MRLGGGFPFADDVIVNFVLAKITDKECSIVTSSPIAKARAQKLSASGSSSRRRKATARGISSAKGAFVIANTAVAQKPKIPSKTAKGNPTSKQPQPTVVPPLVEALRVRAELIWNHAVAVALIQASFEKCMCPKANRHLPP